MTKGIEDTLGLTPLKEALEEQGYTEDELEKAQDDPVHLPENELTTQASTMPQNPLGVNTDKHDKESNEIRDKALNAFDDVYSVGQNVDPVRSARLFEVAAQFLKTAQDATNDKLKRDLEVAKLKLAAQKVQASEGITGALNDGASIMADRNDLLKQMIAESKDSTIIDGDGVEEADEIANETTDE